MPLSPFPFGWTILVLATVGVVLWGMGAAREVPLGIAAASDDPLKAAAERLTADGIDVLHTIGGDDTATTAADLARYLRENGYELTVVGLLTITASTIACVWAWRQWGPGRMRGMATITEAHELLGEDRLWKVRHVVRPDLYPSARKANR